MRGLMWFKKDLRISDNRALYHACQKCEDGVIALYVIDTSMWKKHHTSHCQIAFLLRGLAVLATQLTNIGIPLIVEHVAQTNQIPTTILHLVNQHRLNGLFYNNEYEIDENKRNQQTADLLRKNNVAIHYYDDQLILDPSLLFRKSGQHFKVFTAFKKYWLERYRQQTAVIQSRKLKIINKISINPTKIPSQLPDIHSSINDNLWPAGEIQAHKILKSFIEKRLATYHQQRDFPMLDTTSHLSPYLAVGMISPRECFESALNYNHGELDTGNQGALTWMSELIWREFYRHILIAVPHVCMNKAYQLKTEQLPWLYDTHLLKAWQQGNTGFPIVDAAMRQLNSTGWMHNRLRMVVAMFLSKNMFIDWRLGEQYFTEKLIDIDFASNNGGWQWCASTGTDAVPYFRIFNPTLQSERFDKEGVFIRKFCPELNAFDNKSIHAPHERNSALATTSGYCKPIIDYKKSRMNVLVEYKKISNSRPR